MDFRTGVVRFIYYNSRIFLKSIEVLGLIPFWFDSRFIRFSCAPLLVWAIKFIVGWRDGMRHFCNTRLLLVIAIFLLSSAMVFLERIDSWYCSRTYISYRGQHQYYNKNNEPVFGGAKHQFVLCYCAGLIGFIWRTVLFCKPWLLFINIHIHYRKKVIQYLESTVETLVFGILDLLEINWHQPQTNIASLM